ncbi:MAG: radical SAM protein [Deltaproteobacteria bacterium]|nr:MAG: radical SAM protein [Deltaproteobacteria bacterium]
MTAPPAPGRPARRYIAPVTRPLTRIQLSVILTDACNMRCAYCTTAKRPVWIPAAYIDRILALLDTAPPVPLDVNFHGGEPTLAWPMVVRLAEGLAVLRSTRRLSLNMCTNGTHLDRSRAAFLAAHGFDVRVSIDGRRRTHTRFRQPRPQEGIQAEALFSATLAGLDALRAAGVTVAANMVVTPDTVHDLLSNAVFLVRRGLVHLVVSPVVGMPWKDRDLLALDAQLSGLVPLWRRWMSRRAPHQVEDLRRSILSEIDRATYCIGERMNQPDARVLVIGPDGRIFGDEPDVRSEKALVVGHLDDCRDLTRLPAPPRTAFQLMFDREFYPPHVLRDVRRTHRLLRRHMRHLLRELFGETAPGPPASPAPAP